MRRRLTFCIGGCLLLVLAALVYHFRSFQRHRVSASLHRHVNQAPAVREPDLAAALAEPALPETAPPPGLPIVPWGKRDFFPILRQPTFVRAAEADHLLAIDEPILGLILGGDARAYSTNQLNRHEMVLDEIAGTPVLVTY